MYDFNLMTLAGWFAGNVVGGIASGPIESRLKSLVTKRAQDLNEFLLKHLGEDYLLEQDDHFIIAVAQCLDKLVLERDELKREAIKSILLGYARTEDYEVFKLDKLLHTVSMLTQVQIAILKLYTDGTVQKWIDTQPIDKDQNEYYLNLVQIGEFILSKMCGLTQFEDKDYTFSVLNTLANLDLFDRYVPTGGGLGGGLANDHSFRPSKFCLEFISYIESR